MSVTDTLLIFVGIPALMVVVIVGLVMAGSRDGGGGKRYRPGRPFDFTPVWFLSAPEQIAESTGTALPPGGQAPALTSEKTAAVENRPKAGVTGGASDRW